MIVVNRFRVPLAAQASFRDELQQALDVLATQSGYAHGRIGRNTDDPELWVLTTEWGQVGDYRRALSSYDVKLTAVPVLSKAIDEPSAYEDAGRGADLNRAGSRSLG